MCNDFRVKYILICFLIATASCSKVPNGVVSEKKMENILFDSYIGEGIAEQELTPIYNNDAKKIYLYSVLKKYDVSKAEYDSSLIWYMSNLKVYTKVYERVLERLKKEESKQQLASGDQVKGTVIAKGDTVDLWNKSNKVFFNETPLIGNVFTKIENDNSFQLGDSIKFSAKIRSFYRESNQLPRMVLTLIYHNDTTKTYSKEIVKSNQYSIEIKTDSTRRISQIVAGIYQNHPQVLFIENTRLLRIHPKKKKK